MKIKKQTAILKIMRNILNVKLDNITYHNSKKIHGIISMENGELRPSWRTVVSISDSLRINPDILLYSFGHLPEKERKIISSDPFYYREKIIDLCNNHNNRYEQKIDLDLLNIERSANYIKNNRIEPRKKVRRSKANDTDTDE